MEHTVLHTFYRPISDGTTKTLGIKTEYTTRALFDWSIYLTLLHKIGWSQMNERLTDLSPHEMFLDVR